MCLVVGLSLYYSLLFSMEKLKILIGSYDVFLSMLIRERLLHFNAEFILAYDGIDVIKKSNEYKLEILIIDSMLSKLDYYNVLYYVKRTNPNVHIILLTELHNKSGIESILDNKVDLILKKPVNFSLLFLEIENYKSIHQFS
ncbi:MAG: hypothetical protein Kow0068_05540 [Marinilabiliales bacterium]